jgi:23S rRNA (guanosine2251-2'-O)-methyltransferase
LSKDRFSNRPPRGPNSGPNSGGPHKGGADRSGSGQRGADRTAPSQGARGPKPFSRSFEKAKPFEKDRPRAPAEDRPRQPLPDFEAMASQEQDDHSPWGGRGANRNDAPRDGAPRQQRDRRSGSPGRRPESRSPSFEENGNVWLWGMHATAAALANPRRKIVSALFTRNAAIRLKLDPDALPAYATLTEPDAMDRRLPDGAVHQGAAILAEPLATLDISEAAMRPEKPLVILDQVTDPQNVGAIIRTAAAFGVGAIVLQTRNAPALGGALAKAAAGAVELVEEIRVVNISRAATELADAGWCVVGLAGEADMSLADALDTPQPVAIVLGAEGDGMRQNVAAHCTRIARIPIDPGMESLNVSNAAAVAFYELRRRKP